MIAIYICEVLRVMLDKYFNVTSDVKSNDILELSGGYTWIFVFDDGIEFSK
jgi:hypothetical protein